MTRSDKFKLTVANGLLSTTAVTSTDETKAILTSLAGLVGALAGPPTIKSTRFETILATDEKDLCPAYNYSVVFDPTDRAETVAALSGLARRNSAIAVDVDGFHCEGKSTGEAALCALNDGTERTWIAKSKMQATSEPKGLVYRAPRNVTLSIGARTNFADAGDSACKLENPPTAQAATVVVPDSAASFVLPATAGGFTTATVGHSFKDGMPTEYALSQPSEIAGLASIPVEILKAMVSVPGELLKLRVDYDSSANAALETSVKEQELRLQLLTAQRNLEAATAAQPPAVP